MNQATIYNFQSNNIRVSYQDGEPWFVVQDILDALEYAETTKPSRTILHVPEQWRGVYPIHTPSGRQEMTALSEAGMFFFLNRSDKPKALPFQMWLAGEVLPSIRKTGSYTAAPSKQNQNERVLEEEIEHLSAQVSALKDELLDLYRDKSPVRKVVEKIVNRVPVEAIELMAEYGVPREKIAAVSGKSRGCIRVHLHNAKKYGQLN